MATYVINRIPHAAIEFNVPFEMLFYRKPDIAGIRVFGRLYYAHIKNPIPHKLAPWSQTYIFIGYPFPMKCYYYYDFETGKV